MSGIPLYALLLVAAAAGLAAAARSPGAARLWTVAAAHAFALFTYYLAPFVVAANATKDSVLIAGAAGLVAGAMSMAAGEYVSVSSQADTEKADLARESHELETREAFELQELTAIYEKRGLEPALAREVSAQLMAHDPLGAHARDELGIIEIHRARPLQAAAASASAFAAGAALPLAITFLSPLAATVPSVSGGSLACLAILGGLASRIGGADVVRGAVRVTIWGALAMLATAAVGALFGTVA